MMVQGQIHGGLAQGLGPALYEEIPYDEEGNDLAGSFMDYLVPMAVATPAWETGHTVTPSPHHSLGAKGVGGAGHGGGVADERERGSGRAGALGGDAYGYHRKDATTGMALRIRSNVRESILRSFSECCPSGVIDGRHYDGDQLRAWIEDSAIHLWIQYHNTLPSGREKQE